MAETQRSRGHARGVNLGGALNLGRVFDLDHAKLAADPDFGVLARALSGQSTIDSRASFNRYCREACRLWDEHFGPGPGTTSPRFAELLGHIELAVATARSPRRGEAW